MWHELLLRRQASTAPVDMSAVYSAFAQAAISFDRDRRRGGSESHWRLAHQQERGAAGMPAIAEGKPPEYVYIDAGHQEQAIQIIHDLGYRTSEERNA